MPAETSPLDTTFGSQGKALGQAGRIIEGTLLSLLCLQAAHGPRIQPSARYTFSDMSFLLQWLTERGDTPALQDQTVPDRMGPGKQRRNGNTLEQHDPVSTLARTCSSVFGAGLPPFNRAVGRSLLRSLHSAHTSGEAGTPSQEGSSHQGQPTWHDLLLWAVNPPSSTVRAPLELTSGSWVQNDEAVTPAWMAVQQIQASRAALLKALAPLLCIRFTHNVTRHSADGCNASQTLTAPCPFVSAVVSWCDLLAIQPSLSVAYQNDAFGHSAGNTVMFAGGSVVSPGRATAWVLAPAYESIILNRLPYRDKLGRRAVTRHFGSQVLEPAGQHCTTLLCLADLLMRYARDEALECGEDVLARGVCGMQGFTPPWNSNSSSRTFVHALHEHYNHAALFPSLKRLSQCPPLAEHPVSDRSPLTCKSGSKDDIACVAQAVLAAAQLQSLDYCTGYPLPAYTTSSSDAVDGQAGHVLLIIGDDFSHDEPPAMACLQSNLRAVVSHVALQSKGRVQARVSSFHEFLQAARGHYTSWHTLLSRARSLTQRRCAEKAFLPWALSMTSFTLQQGIGQESLQVPLGTSLPFSAIPSTDTSLLATFPSPHSLLPYQDKPFANAWTGFYSSAPQLKMAVVQAWEVHMRSIDAVQVALKSTGSTAQSCPSLSPFALLCEGGAGAAGVPTTPGMKANVASAGKTPGSPMGVFGFNNVVTTTHVCVHEPELCSEALDSVMLSGPHQGTGHTAHNQYKFTLSPLEARLALLALPIHHDGLTGTSTMAVLSDYWLGVQLAAEHAQLCTQWAASVTDCTWNTSRAAGQSGHTGNADPPTQQAHAVVPANDRTCMTRVPMPGLEGVSFSFAAMPVSQVPGLGGGPYILRTPSLALLRALAGVWLGFIVALLASSAVHHYSPLRIAGRCCKEDEDEEAEDRETVQHESLSAEPSQHVPALEELRHYHSTRVLKSCLGVLRMVVTLLLSWMSGAACLWLAACATHDFTPLLSDSLLRRLLGEEALVSCALFGFALTLIFYSAFSLHPVEYFVRSCCGARSRNSHHADTRSHARLHVSQAHSLSQPCMSTLFLLCFTLGMLQLSSAVPELWVRSLCITAYSHSGTGSTINSTAQDDASTGAHRVLVQVPTSRGHSQCLVELSALSSSASVDAPFFSVSHNRTAVGASGLSVYCDTPHDTEVWMRIHGLDAVEPSMALEDSWAAVPGPSSVNGPSFSSLADVQYLQQLLGLRLTLQGDQAHRMPASGAFSLSETAMSLLASCASTLSRLLALSWLALPSPVGTGLCTPAAQHAQHPRLCIHAGVGWVSRPSAEAGVDLSYSVWPMPEIAVPCVEQDTAQGRGGAGKAQGGARPAEQHPWYSTPVGLYPIHLVSARPTGVAWVPSRSTSSTHASYDALLQLHRHTSVDDEKGLRRGAEDLDGRIPGFEWWVLPDSSAASRAYCVAAVEGGQAVCPSVPGQEHAGNGHVDPYDTARARLQQGYACSMLRGSGSLRTRTPCTERSECSGTNSSMVAGAHADLCMGSTTHRPAERTPGEQGRPDPPQAHLPLVARFWLYRRI